MNQAAPDTFSPHLVNSVFGYMPLIISLSVNPISQLCLNATHMIRFPSRHLHRSPFRLSTHLVDRDALLRSLRLVRRLQPLPHLLLDVRAQRSVRQIPAAQLVRGRSDVPGPSLTP